MLDMYMSNVITQASNTTTAADPSGGEFVDKETNTECAFPPEKSRASRFIDGSSGLPQFNTTSSITKDGNGAIQSTAMDERPVKRSQTFSPSAAVGKGRYICRLNRSDSDSAMHFGVAPHPFQRGAIERRSLRFHTKIPKGVSSK